MERGRLPSHDFFFNSGVRNGNLTIVDWCIKHHPYLLNTKDRDGWGPLHNASHFEQCSTALSLLRAGANPNDEHDETGDSVIHLACGKKRNVRLVQALIETYGVSPNQKNVRLTTPLMIAVKLGHRDIVNYLLAHGSCVHDQNYR